MAHRTERCWATTERDEFAAGFHVPFFAPERGKSFEGRVFTPHFAPPAGTDVNTVRRSTVRDLHYADRPSASEQPLLAAA
jgi:hypothetical protein